MARQISLDAWQARRLGDLLEAASEAAAKTGIPTVLYRQVVEREGEDACEEVICSVTDGHVIEQEITTGGMLPASVGRQRVYPVRSYPAELYRKSRDRFAEVVESLEGLQKAGRI
ncbi:MAG: hypothetical protein MPI95_02420 [Nitrosopumilus sp.]|nr:hypothetical protein [Nitrosopumilus sp.]MDA7941477.1 hypothetical protein [Nitrosopumilus sp.]MDA7943382.1 hypothetical protein [Nitrosopumilus sp.]MDA7944830.1 hypothetical protein [Nitrosopumilus sp.]MDA7952974.1 hypothetical protein [Nitrosopumilus sp.]